MEILTPIMCTIAALALIYMILSSVLSIVIFNSAFKRTEKAAFDGNPTYMKYEEHIKKGMDYFNSLPVEKLEITSSDGLKLKAHFYKNPNERALLVMMHGWHSRGLSDFAPVFEDFISMGLSLLIPSQRAHVESEGEYLTLGIKEKDDCNAWAKLACTLTDNPVIIHGISMGAATVMGATATDLPEKVIAVISDCGYTSVLDQVNHLRKQMHVPAFPAMQAVKWWARKKIGFEIDSFSVNKAIEKCTLPILFIHGGADTFVPTYMGEKNFNTCPSKNKRMVIVPDAGHGLSYMVDHEKVLNAISDFLDDVLKDRQFNNL